MTDAGFRNPWFKKVLELGWDFVGSVRNREMVKPSKNTEWTEAKSLCKEATRKAKNIKATKLAGEDRQFQAKTTTSTSVLSFVLIGIQVFREWRMGLSLILFCEADKHIQFIAKGVPNAC